jgi:hypothetical protein
MDSYLALSAVIAERRPRESQSYFWLGLSDGWLKLAQGLGQGGKGPIEEQSREEKPKADKNKKKSAPVPLAFERVRMIGKEASGKKFS